MLRKDVDLITAVQLKLMENEKSAALTEITSRSVINYDRQIHLLLNKLLKGKNGWL